MRLFANLQVLASFDLDQVQKAFEQELTIDDTDSVTAASAQSGLITLTTSAASVPFNFGSVTAADTLLVIAYDECQLQLDSNTAPLVTVRPVPAASSTTIVSVSQRINQPGCVFWRGRVTSLFLSNPSSSKTAKVFVGIVGNALA